MKRLLSIALLMSVLAFSARAYDFSVVTSGGQTLYYTINGYNGSTVTVTCPGPHNYSAWSGYVKPVGVLQIPDSVAYGDKVYAVTYIGEWAFGQCSGLTGIEIPNTMRGISNSAFYLCYGLTSVSFGGSVKTIDTNAFIGCSSLQRVDFSGSLGQWCRIGFGTPDANPLYYAHHLFVDSVEVTNLRIPGSSESVGDYAFYNCAGLVSLSMDERLTVIGRSAFRGCTGLTSINFTSTLQTIADSAFMDCSGITDITAQAPEPIPLGEDVFHGVSSRTRIHIPCGCTGVYKNSWNVFVNFVEPQPFGFSAVAENSAYGMVQISQEPSCSDPVAAFEAIARQGFVFNKWNDGDTTNPRTIVVSQDTHLVALFVTDFDGGESIAITDNVDCHVTVENAAIVVTGAAGQKVGIFDCAGRCLSLVSVAGEPWVSDKLDRGVYLVKVGDYPAQKVVVL